MRHLHRLRWPTRLSVGIVCAAFALVPPARGQTPPEPYKDTSLSFDKRADDLLAKMTFQEKAGQLTTTVQAVPRLGIPACRIGTEALHGLSGGTTYPDGIALAAMFDPDLLQKVASAIADDARARAGVSPDGNGLFLWCPTVNLARDPRWGRNLETYGEDPCLSSRLGAAYCRGLQGDDPKYLKVIATPKHLVVYSMESGRTSTSADVSERALREYYLPPFEACFVEGHAQSVMSAYNAINGVPCSANNWLLTNVLRDDWKFSGAVVTDAGAVSQIVTGHRYAVSEAEAVALAINSGVDIITNAPASTANTIESAQTQGLLKPGTMDRAVKNSLLLRFKLGIFDPPAQVPFTKPPGPEQAAQHKALALQAARESIVLLQNNPTPPGSGMEKLLPLDLRRISSLAVVGANANTILLGSYAQGANNSAGSMLIDTSTNLVRGTIADAIRSSVGDRVSFRFTGNDPDASVAAAQSSDIVIFVGGLDMRMEHTGVDRPDLNLPNEQRILLDKVVKANPLTVVVLTGGSAIGLETVKAQAPAILMYWYNGEQGPQALADVLFGTYNPAGRLPVTFYRSANDLPSMYDYELTSGRTYMYLKKPATFPFGHGLSYTTFTYRNLHVEPPPSPGQAVKVAVEVTNTGALAGEEVVQLYVRAMSPKAALPRPQKQLAAFQRLSLKPGETRTVHLELPARSFAYWDTATHRFIVEPGPYEVMAGASSEDIKTRAKLEM